MAESAVSFSTAGLVRAFDVQPCFRHCQDWSAGGSSSPSSLALVSCSAHLVSVGNRSEELRPQSPPRVTLRKYEPSPKLQVLSNQTKLPGISFPG